MPATYYHFEPLRFLNDIQIRDNATSSIYALKQILKCNYSSEEYLKRWGFHYNVRLWSFCSAFNTIALCKNRDFLNKFCSLFPFQNLKEVRLRAAVCEPLLTDSDLNVKIILLVRDPRGVYNSRQHASWCLAGGDECKNTTNLCNDMVSDFNAAKYLTNKYPDRFKVVRYEDLSLDPFNVTMDVFKFYGLPFHKGVQKFLTTHTQITKGTIMSTYRNSTETVFAWRRSMSFERTVNVQSQCGEALSLWGYKQILREEDLNSTDFNVLLKSPFAIETGITTESNIETTTDSGSGESEEDKKQEDEKKEEEEKEEVGEREEEEKQNEENENENEDENKNENENGNENEGSNEVKRNSGERDYEKRESQITENEIKSNGSGESKSDENESEEDGKRRIFLKRKIFEVFYL